MHALVLIEKDLPSSPWWKNLVNGKKIEELSVEEIVNKYQGFEGELISFFIFKKNEDKLREAISRFSELKKLSTCLLLHVISGSGIMPSSLREQAVFVGYDIGACDEEKTIYSSIFNEILFGGYDELVSYKDLLNENLLFPDKATAEKYVDLHNQMSAQGKNVEDYMEMIIYEVWKHKD